MSDNNSSDEDETRLKRLEDKFTRMEMLLSRLVDKKSQEQPGNPKADAATKSTETSAGKVFTPGLANVRGSNRAGGSGGNYESDEEAASLAAAWETDGGSEIMLHYEDDDQLWLKICEDARLFLSKPLEARKTAFAEALSPFSVSKDALTYLAKLWWGSVSLAKFLPASMRGHAEADNMLTGFEVGDDGRIFAVERKAKHTHITGLALRAPEWSRGIARFVDAHAQVISPLFGVWGMRYISTILEFCDSGASWPAILKAESTARAEVGKMLRNFGTRGGGKQWRSWRTTVDQKMVHGLAIHSGPAARTAKGDEDDKDTGGGRGRGRGNGRQQ